MMARDLSDAMRRICGCAQCVTDTIRWHLEEEINELDLAAGVSANRPRDTELRLERMLGVITPDSQSCR